MRLSCCGLDCDACDAFIATRNDDDLLREEVACRWRMLYGAPVRADDINCTGCRSDGCKVHFCEHMCTVRKCVMERGFENCAPCDCYPCAALETILSFAPHVRETLGAIRRGFSG